MSRAKQAGKRARTDPNAPQPPLRLSQTPVERWFAEDDERTAFDERLSRMELLPPKYIGDGVLPDVKYPEFWWLIDIQGLRPFLFTHGRYYPRFVAADSTTIFIREDEDEGEEFTLGFRVGGREYKFTLATLATAWGLKDEGDTFKGGSYPLGTWDEFSKATAVRELHLEYAAPGKYAVSRMSTDHRLLLYVLSYVLLPRKSNHGTATEEDLLILWAIVNEKQIHWPYLMANRLFRYSQGRVLTETEVPSQDQSEVIEFMRNGFKGMWVVLSDMFTRLSDRIDGLEAHMTSQDADIRGLRDELRSFKDKDVAINPPKEQDDAPAQD
ncbi:hypothetical protein PIB30_075034 [Stylosanthes scabra]|uniref:Uncharacterized protein n=1 Tax=Stylosanthes scabra TaxID=79078 RepID=A0ABU6YMD7_9FABA|nr:hypothetical protein [Stylosanthes scabra]